MIIKKEFDTLQAEVGYYANSLLKAVKELKAGATFDNGFASRWAGKLIKEVIEPLEKQRKELGNENAALLTYLDYEIDLLKKHEKGNILAILTQPALTYLEFEQLENLCKELVNLVNQSLEQAEIAATFRKAA